MEKATIIGIDLAKRVFQLHGAAEDGRAVLRKKASRSQLLSFLARQPRTVVAMEACATAHGWGRAIMELGHEVRLIPPVYVKPFVRRQKNDAADAEAIAEAASRPSMRSVAVKTEEQQAQAMLFVLATCWCSSGPNWSMRCAAIWPNTALSPRRGGPM